VSPFNANNKKDFFFLPWPIYTPRSQMSNVFRQLRDNQLGVSKKYPKEILTEEQKEERKRKRDKAKELIFWDRAIKRTNRMIREEQKRNPIPPVASPFQRRRAAGPVAPGVYPSAHPQ
jgi:hypothetical protein